MNVAWPAASVTAGDGGCRLGPAVNSNETTAFGIAAIVANVVGGILYDSLGHTAVFGLAALMAIVAASLAWFVFPAAAGNRQATR